MIVDVDLRVASWGELDRDPQCEGCGRSLMGRFGDGLTPSECPSCLATWDLLNRAGKLRIVGEGEYVDG